MRGDGVCAPWGPKLVLWQILTISVSFFSESGSSSGKIEISLNVGLKDGGDETPLSLSLWTNQLEIALNLLDSGADIECQRESDNMTLLYQAIVREQPTACLFLLDHGSNFRRRYMCVCVSLFLSLL